ncbi:MAG TPA: metallophosphoesterase [Chloroflexota bacterium]|nr:metallophosphoesterase [Chloroflexota bacterium]
MKLLIVSDTHLSSGEELPPLLVEAMKGCDLIVHLGDFTAVAVADYLATLGPLAAVCGNMDDRQVRERFPTRAELTIGPYRVALLHGDQGGRTALEAARGARADIVLFGHSHQPMIRRESGKLLFNPGSPTRRRFAPAHTYGVLTINDGVHADLITLSS